MDFISANKFETANLNPTNKFQIRIRNTIRECSYLIEHSQRLKHKPQPHRSPHKRSNKNPQTRSSNQTQRKLDKRPSLQISKTL